MLRSKQKYSKISSGWSTRYVPPDQVRIGFAAAVGGEMTRTRHQSGHEEYHEE